MHFCLFYFCCLSSLRRKDFARIRTLPGWEKGETTLFSEFFAAPICTVMGWEIRENCFSPSVPPTFRFASWTRSSGRSERNPIILFSCLFHYFQHSNLHRVGSTFAPVARGHLDPADCRSGRSGRPARLKGFGRGTARGTAPGRHPAARHSAFNRRPQRSAVEH